MRKDFTFRPMSEIPLEEKEKIYEHRNKTWHGSLSYDDYFQTARFENIIIEKNEFKADIYLSENEMAYYLNRPKLVERYNGSNCEWLKNCSCWIKLDGKIYKNRYGYKDWEE